MHFVHLKTSGFLRVLRTLDRIVRSNTWFIHSLLRLGLLRRARREMLYEFDEAQCVHPVFAPRWALKTLVAAPHFGAFAKCFAAVDTEDRTRRDLLHARATWILLIVAGKRQQERAVAAGCCRGFEDRLLQSTGDVFGQQANSHNRADNPLKFLLPEMAVRLDPSRSSMVFFPRCEVGNLVQERCQKCVGIEVFVDAYPVEWVLPPWGTVVAQFGATRSAHPHNHGVVG